MNRRSGVRPRQNAHSKSPPSSRWSSLSLYNPLNLHNTSLYNTLSLNISEPEHSQPIEPTLPAEPVLEPAATAKVAGEPAAAEPKPAPELESQDAAPTPAPPARSDLLELILQFFKGGNTVARVGIALLTIGSGFLVQLAAREGWLPIELRLSAAALIGSVLVALGWRLREKRSAYALSLQGGGVGITYLSIFAAIQIYGLIPTALGFVLLALVAAAATVLAVVQNALSLALLGTAGGFLAPFFAAGEGGSHITLFSYYLVLNLGILLVAWRKAWRPLNLLGYVATFITGTIWGGLNYSPRLFASTEPFLLAFFLLYVTVAVLYALRQPPKLRGLMDATLVFSLPVIVFSLQVALVQRFELGVAFSALGFAAFYLGLAYALYRRAPKNLGILAEAFSAIGIVFTALALPFAFDASWVSAGWALGAAGLVWIGVRQERVWLRFFGLAWHLLALGAWGFIFILNSFFTTLAGRLPFALTLDAAVAALALLFSAYTLASATSTLKRWERILSPVYLTAGLLAWTVTGQLELSNLPSGYNSAALLGFLALTAFTCFRLAPRLKWSQLNLAALSLPLIAGIFVGVTYQNVSLDSLPVGLFSVVMWSFAFWVIVKVLQRSATGGRLLEGLYALSFWTLCATLLFHANALAFYLAEDWRPLVTLAPVLGLVLLLSAKQVRAKAWLNDKVSGFLMYALAPVVALVWLGSLGVNIINNGGSAPLPYLPLLNPLDLILAFSLLTFTVFLRRIRAELELPQGLRRGLTWALIAFGLLWASGMIARSVHHWLGVPYTFDGLFASNVLQTSLSIFWALFALVAMLMAQRLHNRTPWVVGAGLLALVIVKLVFVELANVAPTARVVSFMGVGALLLVIGYLAPLPPATEADEVAL